MQHQLIAKTPHKIQKDKEYKNDSYDRKYKIGDTVTIEYNQYLPFINRIKGAEW